MRTSGQRSKGEAGSPAGLLRLGLAARAGPCYRRDRCRDWRSLTELELEYVGSRRAHVTGMRMAPNEPADGTPIPAPLTTVPLNWSWSGASIVRPTESMCYHIEKAAVGARVRGSGGGSSRLRKRQGVRKQNRGVGARSCRDAGRNSSQ